MKKQDYIKTVDQLNPDIYLKSRLEQKIREPIKERKKYKWSIAVFSSIFLLIIIYTSFIGTGIFHKTNDSFNVYAYSERETIDINKDAVVSLPGGKINISENGDWWMKGKVNFYVQGESIDTVFYKSENGMFFYNDIKKRDEMAKKGELYTAKFFLDVDKYNIDLQKFWQGDVKELWDNGTLDEIKEKYFAGLSTDLNNYIIKYSHSATTRDKQPYDDLFGESVAVPRDYMAVEIRTKEQDKNEGQWRIADNSFATEYYDDYYKTLNWSHTKAIEAIQKKETDDFSKLPEDVITIRVNFKDGEIKTIAIQVSYDAEGNSLAKVM